MVIALSFVLYNWSVQQAEQRTQEIEERADPLVCDQIGISVDSSCQDFKSVKLNISNTDNYEVAGIELRMLGLYPEDDDYLQTKRVVENIIPGHTEKFTILKQGTLSQVAVVPLAKRNNKLIYCEEQAVVREKGELKQC